MRIFLISMLFSISSFATCVTLFTQKDNNIKTDTGANRKIRIEVQYCSNKKYTITLDNINPFLDSYSGDFSKEQIRKISKTLKKMMLWAEKARKTKVNFKKTVTIKKYFFIFFNSADNGQTIKIMLFGENDSMHYGVYILFTKQDTKELLDKFIKAEKTADEKIKKINEMFK